MRHWIGSTLIAGALALAHGSPASAAACVAEPHDRPKIGLALGGGAARGAAHIGVLKELEALGVPVDYVAGTSVGSIIGGLYATGLSAAEIETIYTGVDWDAVFRDAGSRSARTFRRKRDDDLDFIGPKIGYRDGDFILPEGVLAGQRITLLLARLTLANTHAAHFDDLPIPFRAIAADVVTGQEVEIDSGSLARAMRASLSVPGVFAPVDADERLLVDGGIVNNLPVEAVRRMGADVVIAVDVSSPLLPREKLANAFAVVAQLTNLLVYNSTRAQVDKLEPRDILLMPGLASEIGSADFKLAAKAITYGEEAVASAADWLAELALPPAEYARHRARIEGCRETPPVLRFVRLDNRSAFSDEVIRERLAIRHGRPLDFHELERGIALVQGLGNLREVSYELIDDNGTQGLLVRVRPEPGAPNLFEYGLDFFSDGEDNAINFRVGFLKTAIGRAGGEWRSVLQLGEDPGVFTELYRPTSAGSQYYLNPRANFTRDTVPVFGDGETLAEAVFTQADVELVIGKEFGNSADLALGWRGGAGEAHVKVGDPALIDVDYDVGEAFLRFRYDHLDNLYFPNHGGIGRVLYTASREGLGADVHYQQLNVDYFYNWTYGRKHNVSLGTSLNATLDEDAPVYALFRAGGFTRLSGLEFNQLSGQHFGLALAGYRYQFGQGGFLPSYIGGTLELGNVWDDLDDVSLGSALIHGSAYFGYRSPLGPLYLGTGFGEAGERTFFLQLGRVFGPP